MKWEWNTKVVEAIAGSELTLTEEQSRQFHNYKGDVA